MPTTPDAGKAAVMELIRNTCPISLKYQPSVVVAPTRHNFSIDELSSFARPTDGHRFGRYRTYICLNDTLHLSVKLILFIYRHF